MSRPVAKDRQGKLTPAQQALVTSIIPFVWQRSIRWVRMVRNGRPHLVDHSLVEDLFEEALLEVTRAARRYNPNWLHKGKPVKFISFAGKYITRGLQSATRQMHLIGPSFAGPSGIPRVPDYVERMHFKNDDGQVESLNFAARAEKDYRLTDELKAILKCLAPRERVIVLMMCCEDLTLREVAKHFGICKERVRQLYNRAKAKLRDSKVVRDTLGFHPARPTRKRRRSCA